MKKLAKIMAEEIGVRGIISFARFMELALYCPDCGFYEKERDNIGRRGDYVTSVSIGPLFGELLAFQFAQWLEDSPISNLPSSICYQLVEAGAHDGRLASDILNWLRNHRPDIFSRLEYCIVEPSLRRRQWQAQTLAEFRDHVRWVPNLSALTPIPHSAFRTPHSALLPRPPSPVTRHLLQIIFSNELLDAMPVHRLGWDAKAKTWFEWGVTIQQGRFTWAKTSPTIQRFNDLTIQRLTPFLPDDFTLDVCPAAEQWWAEAARSLTSGKLLTIDYGLTAEESLAPQRKVGTLRAYRQHQPSPDVLADPGEQDLTAHINFTALQTAGESAGLTTEAFVTQEQFLMEILGRVSKSETSFPTWIASRKRQLQTLTHPDLMGGPFRVLVQSRSPGGDEVTRL